MCDKKTIPVVILIIVLLVIGIIVGIFLIAFSFGVVDPTYQAFVYNTNTQQLEFKDGSLDSGELYAANRYFLGVGKTFIVFPTTYQTINFNAAQGDQINVRSADGLVILMDVAFQYTLTAVGKDLMALYVRWQEGYNDAIGKIARNIIRDVAANYQAFEFFFNRSIIVGDMTSALYEYILNVGATVNNFQMLNIILPPLFNDAIQQTEVVSVQISEATVLQQKTLIEAETNLLAAQKQATVILTQAQARADASLIQQQQNALAIKATIEQEIIALQSLMQQLNFTIGQLFDYLLIDALSNTNAKLTMSVEKPRFTFSN